MCTLFILSFSCSPFGSTNNAAIDICIQVSMCARVFISLGYVSRNGVAGSYGSSMISFEELASVPTAAASSHMLTSNSQGSLFLTSSPTLVICPFFCCYRHPSEYKILPPCGFDLQFLNDQCC